MPEKNDSPAGRADVQTRAATTPPAQSSPPVPIDVVLVLEMLAGRALDVNRRAIPRCPYVVLASVELSREPGRRRWIYTRDVHQTGIGFITQELLPEGSAGTIHLTVSGEPLALSGVLLRSRKVFGEWHEGAITLSKEEPRLAWKALTHSG
jgi:hypothetical protein